MTTITIEKSNYKMHSESTRSLGLLLLLAILRLCVTGPLLECVLVLHRSKIWTACDSNRMDIPIVLLADFRCGNTTLESQDPNIVAIPWAYRFP